MSIAQIGTDPRVDATRAVDIAAKALRAQCDALVNRPGVRPEPAAVTETHRLTARLGKALAFEADAWGYCDAGHDPARYYDACETA